MVIPHESDDVILALDLVVGPVDVIVSVGCGDGYELSNLHAGRKIGIDAHPEMSACLFGGDFHPGLAISHVSGVAEFWDGPSPGCSSLHNRGGKSRIVQVLRLDDFLWRMGVSKVDALLIDTEGTTLDVLIGCGKILDTARVVYAEVQFNQIYPNGKLFPEVNDFLVSRGFTLTDPDKLPSYDAGDQGNRLWVRK
jgi:hypothetical protein